MKELRTTPSNEAVSPAEAAGAAARRRVADVTVQFSHPLEDTSLACALRADGLVPLLVNGSHLAATTEDHLQEALDAIIERVSSETPERTRRLRSRLVEGLAATLEAGPDADFTSFSDDAVLLLAEGLVHHGYRYADALPFCAVRFHRADVDVPELAQRPAGLNRRAAPGS